jgi:hypothetical protein
MKRFALALVLIAPTFCAFAADACRVTGTAYDAAGRPLRDAVVRLIDLETRQTAFSAADAHSAFAFEGVTPADVGRYRIDVLSAPTRVTGSQIPTRSVLGMSATFACASGQIAQQDVRVQVN